MDRIRLAAVAVIDCFLVLALVVVGQLDHGQDPVGAPLGALEAAAPFIAGWLVAAVLAGAFRRRSLERPRVALQVTTVAWLAGVHLGLLVRAAPQTHGGIEWPFGLVMTGFGLIALLAWRGGLATALEYGDLTAITNS